MSKQKFKILIVDDSTFNRELLKDMLEEDYDVDEAENGEVALTRLEKNPYRYDLVLLDIVMPAIDGFSVLYQMQRNGWLAYLPVIMISAETALDAVHRSYRLGATDFISRPFDTYVVRQRVHNTIHLYAKQRRLEQIVADKIAENEKRSALMTSILSHIVEFRNGESGPHVLNIKKITEMLLRELMKQKKDLSVSAEEIALICNAATLHDVGKISISNEILNKSSRLTDEEYDVMKKHSEIGADMLRALPIQQEEPLLRYAYEICRWHHERYDGKGYPDGLRGEEIPLAAQVVALADVYDALTADRCYRRGFSHEKAMTMILNGECGAFSEDLLACLVKISDKLPALSTYDYAVQPQLNDEDLRLQVRKYEELSETVSLMHSVQAEREKADFLCETLKQPFFTYRAEPEVFTLSNFAAAALSSQTVFVDPFRNEGIKTQFGLNVLTALCEKARETTYDSPEFTIEHVLTLYGKVKRVRMLCRSIWVSDPPVFYGFVGRAESVKGRA